MLLQAAATVLFAFSDPRITESSGLAADPGGAAFYTANDSGDDLRAFTVDSTGRTLAVTDFPGVDARDVEDLALGPGPSLYLADTGDNRSVRPRVLLHRLPLPAVPTRPVGTVVGTGLSTVSLTYEDGPHDAEALLVHPRTGQVLVVTKGLLGSSAYAAPQPLADGVLRKVADVAVRTTGTPGGPGIGPVAQVLVTGGAVSPDGRRLVLRTYTDAYVYDVPGDDLVAALATTPTLVPLPDEPQGEAVTFTPDGTGLVTSSEGAGAAVTRYAAPPEPARTTAPAPAAAAPAEEPSPSWPVWGGAVLLAAVFGGLATRRRRHG